MSEIKAKVAGFTRVLENEGELIALVSEGIVLPYDPVFHPSMGRWAHAQEIPELVQALEIAKAKQEEKARALANRSFFKRLFDRLRGRS